MSLNSLQKTSLGLYLPYKDYPDWEVPNNENFKTINAQLENKANESDVILQPINLVKNDNLNNYKIPGMYYCGSGTYGILNVPVSNTSFSLLVEKTGNYGVGVKQTFTAAYSTGHDMTYTRISNINANGDWGTWKQLATAETPTLYPLSFVSGVVNVASRESCFCKTQDGRVFVHIAATGVDFVSQQHFATLPVGFHPSSDIEVPVVCRKSNSSSDFIIGAVNCNPSGYLHIQFVSGTIPCFYCNLSFIAKV